jgi:hypothetical protein
MGARNDPVEASTDFQNVERSRMLCCAQYRTGDLVRRLSSRTLVYPNANSSSETTPRSVVKSKCWHCTHAFEWASWPLPYRRRADSEEFESLGSFCSPSCCLAWVLLRKEYNVSHVIAWIRSSASKRGIADFAPAPPAHWLVEYGGCLTISEFRNHGASSMGFTEKGPPFVSHPLVLECVNIYEEADEAAKRVKVKNKRATVLAMDATGKFNGVSLPIDQGVEAGDTTNNAQRETHVHGLYHDFLKSINADSSRCQPSARFNRPTIGRINRRCKLQAVSTRPSDGNKDIVDGITPGDIECDASVQMTIPSGSVDISASGAEDAAVYNKPAAASLGESAVDRMETDAGEKENDVNVIVARGSVRGGSGRFLTRVTNQNDRESKAGYVTPSPFKRLKTEIRKSRVAPRSDVASPAVTHGNGTLFSLIRKRRPSA